jgi:hypothetical protein
MNLAAGVGDQGVSGRTTRPIASGDCVMGRVILAFTGNAVGLLPRPMSLLKAAFGGFWQELTRDAIRPYRPELHYMRGPGPAWRAKHGLPPV